VQGSRHQRFVSILAHWPTDDKARIGIQQRCQVQPTLVYPNAHDVADPFFIRCPGTEIALKQIRSDRTLVLTIGGANAALPDAADERPACMS